MLVVSALDKFRLEPVEMGQISSLHLLDPAAPERPTGIGEMVDPEQSGSKNDRNQGKDSETTRPYDHLSADNAAVLFVDHQTSPASGVQPQTPASWR